MFACETANNIGIICRFITTVSTSRVSQAVGRQIDINHHTKQRCNATHTLVSRIKMAPCQFLCSLESVLSRDIYLSSVEIVLKFSSICEGKGPPRAPPPLPIQQRCCMSGLICLFLYSYRLCICLQEWSFSCSFKFVMIFREISYWSLYLIWKREKSAVFWDVTPCSLNYNSSWRVSSSAIWRRVVCCVATDVSGEHIAAIFRGQEIIQQEPACHLLTCWFLLDYFDPEDGGDMFLRNVGWNSTDYTAS
jgi:hypothetical protein